MPLTSALPAQPAPSPKRPPRAFPRRRIALALVTLTAVVAGSLWVVNQGGGQDEQAGDKGESAETSSPRSTGPATP
ncbi:hypothetical protein [Streptomyces scopuliridis]|uniref:hypothetical protein n=1 Tax=Streptomyces scopuliridis TaxID=452529 RepID=UPI0036B3C78D